MHYFLFLFTFQHDKFTTQATWQDTKQMSIRIENACLNRGISERLLSNACKFLFNMTY